MLLGTVCVLYLLPLCWVLAILNSTLFLGNTQFYQGMRPGWKCLPCVGWVGERLSEARDPALGLSLTCPMSGCAIDPELP